jgi:hypothetical protein
MWRSKYVRIVVAAVWWRSLAGAVRKIGWYTLERQDQSLVPIL